MGQVSISLTGNSSHVCICSALVPPTIRGTDSDLPDEVTVLVNKTAQLECHVEGTPAPKISWFKHNQPITSNSLHRILSNGRALQVTTRKLTPFTCYVYVNMSVSMHLG